jgi:hypothetical protein
VEEGVWRERGVGGIGRLRSFGGSELGGEGGRGLVFEVGVDRGGYEHGRRWRETKKIIHTIPLQIPMYHIPSLRHTYYQPIED